MYKDTSMYTRIGKHCTLYACAHARVKIAMAHTCIKKLKHRETHRQLITATETERHTQRSIKPARGQICVRVYTFPQFIKKTPIYNASQVILSEADEAEYNTGHNSAS